MQDPPKPSTTKEREGMWLALGLVWEMGYIIAVPAFVFAFIGAYLDKYFGSSPFILLFAILLSLLISLIGVVRMVKRILK